MSDAPSVILSGTCEMDGRQLFADVSLQMKASEWTCLLGPSGAGKSTILRLLAGLDIGGTFQGEISASDGRPLTDRVAFMAQDDLLFPWLNVLNNVCLGARLRGQTPETERARDLLGQVGLADQINRKPETLSGGERQRAALVRTMMEDRPVILLDEPFSALDAGTRAEMQELAFSLFADRTILLVTHDPTEAARIADCLYIMERSGLRSFDVPATAPVRALDDPAALQCQARLLMRLRGVV